MTLTLIFAAGLAIALVIIVVEGIQIRSGRKADKKENAFLLEKTEAQMRLIKEIKASYQEKSPITPAKKIRMDEQAARFQDPESPEVTLQEMYDQPKTNHYRGEEELTRSDEADTDGTVQEMYDNPESPFHRGYESEVEQDEQP